MSEKKEHELERIDTPVFEQAVSGMVQRPKPTYAGSFDAQLTDIMDKITNREEFQYDVGSDALYNQLKDRYIQQGKLAMKDSMGQAAALTGGYGSTYGQQVGQQTYDAYLQNLGDAVPELYQMAYSRYADEGNALRDQLSIVGALRDDEYNRYRDDLGDWNYEQELAAKKEQQDYERGIYEQELAYEKQQQAYANLYALIKSTGYTPSDAELAAAGMTRAGASALAAEYQRQITPVITATPAASGGGSRGGGGSSGYDPSVAALQQQLNAMGAGLVVDGIMGPKTQAAMARFGIGSGGTSGGYNLGELTDATASGMSKSQIEQVLANRGVNINDKAVQQDIKWALSK